MGRGRGEIIIIIIMTFRTMLRAIGTVIRIKLGRYIRPADINNNNLVKIKLRYNNVSKVVSTNKLNRVYISEHAYDTKTIFTNKCNNNIV